eukprot:CAMPEP_0172418800 /NCGR_PEP_ID=MMETSP1064-20121228/5243_1 /TAXON_ID=202472 /ORGANISM="Aulacoseira subarctica , Strain CCAP 1002/5" /LENGTH=671 /DNA_ID=CAMNT_0013157905 /DNA_START=223 /DNA_END=2238 /DNA_ORIENTATION=+
MIAIARGGKDQQIDSGEQYRGRLHIPEATKSGAKINHKGLKAGNFSLKHAKSVKSGKTLQGACWADGTICVLGKTCNSCCNGSSFWANKDSTQKCGTMPTTKVVKAPSRLGNPLRPSLAPVKIRQGTAPVLTAQPFLMIPPPPEKTTSPMYASVPMNFPVPIPVQVKILQPSRKPSRKPSKKPRRKPKASRKPSKKPSIPAVAPAPAIPPVLESPPSPPSALRYSMIFSSDPQYEWYDGVFPGNLPECLGDDKNICNPRISNAKRQITQQYQSMANLEKYRNQSNVKGVVINGDLTAFGQYDFISSRAWQLKWMKGIIEQTLSPTLDVFPALGNHDYLNNVDNCFENMCASSMVNYMKDWLISPSATKYTTGFSMDNFPRNTNATVFHGSLSYSFNIGKVHYVILQLYPSYRKHWENYFGYRHYVMLESWDWLQFDLASARKRGDIIFVFTHAYEDTGGGWNNRKEIRKFNQMLCKYSVSAFFSGHLHWLAGYQKDIGYCKIPFFRTGSAGYQHYLVADINILSKSMTIWVREDQESSPDPINWDPSGGQYNSEPKPDKLWNVTLHDNLGFMPVPPKSKKGFVSFNIKIRDCASLRIRYSLPYDKDMCNTRFEKCNLYSGGAGELYHEIPEYATNIQIWAATGAGETIVFEEYSAPPILCYLLSNEGFDRN